MPVDACFKRGLCLRDACDVVGGAEKYFLKCWQTADLKTHVSLEVLCNLAVKWHGKNCFLYIG